MQERESVNRKTEPQKGSPTGAEWVINLSRTCTHTHSLQKPVECCPVVSQTHRWSDKRRMWQKMGKILAKGFPNLTENVSAQSKKFCKP